MTSVGEEHGQRDGARTLIDAERLERLICALEALVNIAGRLVRTFEARQKKSPAQRTPRSPRAALEKMIELTPLAEMRVNRALARLRK